MRSGVSLNPFQEFDPLTACRLTREQTVYLFFKRVMDLAVSIPSLIILFPLIVLLAILIRLDSPGPALFVQNRIGARRVTFNGFISWRYVEFPLYKFRTMVFNADPALHQQYIKAFINGDQESMAELQGGEVQTHKLVSDPRVTRFGKFLRKSSLDELPQLINILKGEMSLVGPRPAIPYEVEQYESWHLRRLEALPGLTGLWQVTARSSVDFDEMVQLDLDYIDHQSLWLDIKILLKTPVVVLSGKGAH